ncbi:MAG: ferredoxin--NADP reductase [Thiolinea sp.]
MATPITRSAFVEGKVISNTRLSERLYALKINMTMQAFRAGQFVRLQLPVGEEKVAKSYSLVNAPDDPVAEVFFNTVPDGRLSNALAALQAGDTVEVSQPANGFFVLEELPQKPELWLFATGTGLGPYLSMLRTEKIWQQFEKVVLIHGVAIRDELAYQELIQTALAEHPEQLQYISCVTREPNPDGFEGRLTEALSSGWLEQQTAMTISADNSAIMLCGNHAMIQDMKALLKERGMKKHLRHKAGNIVTEQYF